MEQPQPTVLHHTSNPMAAYSELPNACYRDQEPGEEVKVLLRQHPILNLRWVIPALIGFAAPFIIGAINPASLSGFEYLANTPQPTVFLVLLLWYTFVIGYALQSFLSWYYNVYLITDRRIVDVDFLGLLRYASTEAELRQIQDVEHDQSGLWQMLFNYGQVKIQTAGVRQNLKFEKVPKAHRVADIITDLLPEERILEEEQQPPTAPATEEVLS
jgi:uncharacterized membrane protein YdbT with pleckstrin-like domain